MPDYTTTIMISGEECDYDAEGHIALIYCNSCSAGNEVEVFLDDQGEPEFMGFVCEKCNAWNGPE